MNNQHPLETLVQKIRANKKYSQISEHLIYRLAAEALDQGLSVKLAVKSVRNKLHQVGGAYFRQTIDYSQTEKLITNLPGDLTSNQTKQFCIRTMQMHASTAERLPILETFFNTCLESIAPVNAVLDLACGLNPLALPWMPLAHDFTYHAWDIYQDMLNIIQHFFNHFNLAAKAMPCDLLGPIPQVQTQVAFLLKSIPCLEQMDKNIGLKLLEVVPASYILVSFPVSSLGGQKKGMTGFYRDHFLQMVSEKTWHVKEYLFKTELAFLVNKNR